mmetsp:Transcript_7536/g.19091  ORF Transcript_7536/g.19091 Transcript_7536/m.19091 type:complete len:559 (+) Transcript_7536:71-1747(+)|eukprot:jgi/Tetstr1/465225/TSEL_009931.t1
MPLQRWTAVRPAAPCTPAMAALHLHGAAQRTFCLLLLALMASQLALLGRARQLRAGFPYPEDPPAWCMGSPAGRQHGWDDGKCQGACVDNESGHCPSRACICNLNTYGKPIRRVLSGSQCFGVSIDMYSNHMHVGLNSSMEGAVVRVLSPSGGSPRRPTPEHHDAVVSRSGFVRLDREMPASLRVREPWSAAASEGSEASESDSGSERIDWAGRWTLCVDAPGSSSEASAELEWLDASDSPRAAGSSDDGGASPGSRRLMAVTPDALDTPPSHVSVSVTATICPISQSGEVCFGHGMCQEHWSYCSGKGFFSRLCQRAACECDCGWEGVDCSIPAPCHSPPMPPTPPFPPALPPSPQQPLQPPPSPPAPASPPPTPPASPPHTPSSPASPSPPPQPPMLPPTPASFGPPPVELFLPSANASTPTAPERSASNDTAAAPSARLLPNMERGHSTREPSVHPHAPRGEHNSTFLAEPPPMPLPGGAGPEALEDAAQSEWRAMEDWIVYAMLGAITVLSLLGMAFLTLCRISVRSAPVAPAPVTAPAPGPPGKPIADIVADP